MGERSIETTRRSSYDLAKNKDIRVNDRLDGEKVTVEIKFE